MARQKAVGLAVGAASITLGLFLLARGTKTAPPIPPPGLANLSGFIYDAETQAPINNAAVVLGELMQTTTDSSGYFQFLEVQPSEYILGVAKNGYHSQSVPLLLVEGNNPRDIFLVPTEEPPPGEELAFAFGNPSLSIMTCPVATAWKTPTFTCNVRNNNAVPVTRVINMRHRRYKVRTATWYGPFDEQEGLIELSLNPGESYLYKFEGYHEQWDDPGDWECDPAMGSTYNWEFWLEDELGNKSEIATART